RRRPRHAVQGRPGDRAGDPPHLRRAQSRRAGELRGSATMAGSNKPPHPATLAAQGLGWIDETTGAVVMPVHTATTFLRDPDNQYRRGRSYGRADNPTYDQAQALLTALEGGAASLLFASGMAAAAAVFQSLPRDAHVVAPRVMYWGLRSWLRNFAEAWGMAGELVDAT